MAPIHQWQFIDGSPTVEEYRLNYLERIFGRIALRKIKCLMLSTVLSSSASRNDSVRWTGEGLEAFKDGELETVVLVSDEVGHAVHAKRSTEQKLEQTKASQSERQRVPYVQTMVFLDRSTVIHCQPNTPFWYRVEIPPSEVMAYDPNGLHYAEYDILLHTADDERRFTEEVFQEEEYETVGTLNAEDDHEVKEIVDYGTEPETEGETEEEMEDGIGDMAF
ncbi:hypothetical protein BU26DRAFT_115948 [Trematosphaeria pertusa]|uniref:Uncharacterized protein n=1 Tax=Trematosphaeria pertusa TaxID=390896 RepID=A0A6A6I0A8_9PLEO|nr:uncharacterized protein BU26DRAFT_115948 [Trematosphaeria pertusa]KAF2243323.1 hypothetical protein BU26DRAFT_115948 [Trematosphaeria pertusa]